MKNDCSYIGCKQDFIDAKEKVTGKAKYLDDMNFPGMLYAKILRSPHPHARILSIDVSKAEELPGVKAVITAKDCPANKFGMEIADVTMLAIDKVRYVGDEIAALAADSEEIAEEAIKLIDVKYELLNVVDDVEKAMLPESALVHENIKNNIVKEYHISRDNVDEDFSRCDYVFESEFSTHRVSGCYMEPFGAVAKWEENGRLTIWTGLQSLFQGRNEIAKALGIEPSRITVKSPFIGGGFGAKIWIRNFHPIVAVLAQKTNAPVKYVLTREEEMLTTRPRVAPKIKLKLGMMKDGTLVCKESKIIADNGAYSWAAPKVLLNMAMRTDCLYRFKSTRTDAYLVYTNLIPTSGFRGYGNSQMHFALESFIDTCCRRIGLDPVKVKLKNAVQRGDLTLHGWKIKSCGLTECIDKAYKYIQENRLPKEEQNGRIKRGIGIACMNHVSGNRGGTKFDGSSAMIRIHEDGKVFVFSGEADMGQGAKTVFAQIAAEVLGVDIADITVMPLDTDISPFGLGTYSSRVTTVGGKAVYLAAGKVKKQIMEYASKVLEKPEDKLIIKNGRIMFMEDENIGITLKKLCESGIRTRDAIPFTAYITYDPPTEGTDASFYGDYSSAYTYGAHGVEVEVDTMTGKVKVLRIVAAHDVGKIINKNGVLGQINGGVAQGIGWTLYENMVFQDGKPLSNGLKNYILMTIKDMPEIASVVVETNDPIGPFGAKGIGEPTLIPTAPAIANAIEDAIGIRIKDLPITSEKVFWAIKEKEEGGR
ncbi:xanthine dehydrogenase family protein molybdopterin-binding subunit [Lutispora saccharofermentans]|uniref:Xanthine dehydrogenase family protein molybdopterin-binding subunit n=1 Tax=Lutispora saccharofermentans TaxID=3024236 RepID=A0ABT1NEF3_9FIRM|nr:xanthine dehydrogenase family protein molybdopterin-binding subunit [Lutispora saccharofermentans]MCQ1529612.1 xanthine dehydrogenase family protein molybdopterin-binding subunit [Lutispora saccharofermentans]